MCLYLLPFPPCSHTAKSSCRCMPWNIVLAALIQWPLYLFSDFASRVILDLSHGPVMAWCHCTIGWHNNDMYLSMYLSIYLSSYISISAVCTNVIRSPGPPPLAFFGQQQKVFVQMYAEPQPSTHSPEVYLAVNSVSLRVHQLEVEIFRTTRAPLLTWVYTLDIPDVESAENATLEFSATYGTAHDTQCSGDNVVSYNIPVIRSTSEFSPP